MKTILDINIRRYAGNIRSPIYVLESLETQELLANLDISPPFHNLNNYTITSSILIFLMR